MAEVRRIYTTAEERQSKNKILKLKISAGRTARRLGVAPPVTRGIFEARRMAWVAFFILGTTCVRLFCYHSSGVVVNSKILYITNCACSQIVNGICSIKAFLPFFTLPAPLFSIFFYIRYFTENHSKLLHLTIF